MLGWHPNWALIPVQRPFSNDDFYTECITYFNNHVDCDDWVVTFLTKRQSIGSFD